MPAGLQAMTASRNGRLGIVVGVLVVAGAALLLIPVLGSGSSPAPTAHPQTVSTVSPSSVTATASSTERTEGNVTYTAANTLDGDPATAWNSNGDRDGPGPGIWLRYSFSTPLDLRGITVLNGYQKVTPRANKPPLDLYQANERLHRVKVTTQTGSWTWDLQDSRTPQTFSQKLGRTSWVKLQIVSVYPSTAYRDVGLSDISFTAAQ